MRPFLLLLTTLQLPVSVRRVDGVTRRRMRLARAAAESCSVEAPALGRVHGCQGWARPWLAMRVVDCDTRRSSGALRVPLLGSKAKKLAFLVC